MSKVRINVVLSVANTGFDAESDWDSWVVYVDEHIDELVEDPVAVTWPSFAAACRNPTDKDVVRVAASVGPVETEALVALVRDAIQTLWERWCAEGAPDAEPGWDWCELPEVES